MAKKKKKAAEEELEEGGGDKATEAQVEAVATLDDRLRDLAQEARRTMNADDITIAFTHAAHAVRTRIW